MKYLTRPLAALLAVFLLLALCACSIKLPAISAADGSNDPAAVKRYDQTVEETDADTLQTLWDAAVSYNENLYGTPAHDPFIAGGDTAKPDNYDQTLSLPDTDIMGIIEIPTINVDLPIYHGTSADVLEKGIGHLEASSMPVGGADTHCVLVGHTGINNAKLFTDLVKLNVGDVFYLHVLGRTLEYQVDQIEVVLPLLLDDLKRVEGQDYCTLVTAYPYGINTHRLFVRGTRIDYTP